MRRRVIAVVLPAAFVFATFATPAKADPLEQVTVEATGILPLGATVTVNNPLTTTGVRVCITSMSAGELVCTSL